MLIHLTGRRRLCAVASLLLLTAAAADSPLSSGLWELRNTPAVATLDGRPLSELPIGPIKTQRLCVGTGTEADPVRFLTRDLEKDCTVASSSIARGRVSINGTCPSGSEDPPGSFELSGKLGRSNYDVNFATTRISDNGRMTFSGRMTGRRIGACPRR